MAKGGQPEDPDGAGEGKLSWWKRRKRDKAERRRRDEARETRAGKDSRAGDDGLDDDGLSDDGLGDDGLDGDRLGDDRPDDDGLDGDRHGQRGGGHEERKSMDGGRSDEKGTSGNGSRGVEERSSGDKDRSDEKGTFGSGSRGVEERSSGDKDRSDEKGTFGSGSRSVEERSSGDRSRGAEKRDSGAGGVKERLSGDRSRGAGGSGGPQPESGAKKAREAAPRRRVASLDKLSALSDEELAELPDPPPSALRRLPWWAVLGLILLVVMVSFVLYGEVNSQRYYLVCKSGTAEAHQGRGFPWPFGHSALGGPQYRPVPLGPESSCESQELDSEDQLQQSMLGLLVVELDRLRLVTRLADVQRARRLLTQAFSLARGEKVALARLRGLKAHFDLQEGLLVLRDVERSLLEAQRLFQAARDGYAEAGHGKTEDPTKVEDPTKAADSKKAANSPRAADSKEAADSKKAADSPRAAETREVDRWIALVKHLLERLRAGTLPPRDPTGVPTLPFTLPLVLPPIVTIPSPDAGLEFLDSHAPRQATGLEAPRGLPFQEPPQPAIPILPDAGVRGGGILL